MKQFQFTFRDNKALEKELKKLRQWVRGRFCSDLLIQMFTETADRRRIERACATVGRILPEALYAGCSSNGNIVNGDFSGDSVAVVCTMFEYPTTKVELLQYPMPPDAQESVAETLAQEVGKRPWVKAVEMLVTIHRASMMALCDGLSRIRQGVQLFGGGAFCEDVGGDDVCVFSKAGGYQEDSAVFILFGGEDFYVESFYVTGWMPLGIFMEATKTDGSLLMELDHRPAYEAYYKYLHIRNDEQFFNNTLEFPFLYRQHGIDIMRAPVANNPDGSLTLTSDMRQNVKVRIAYGDPWTILDSVWKEGKRLLEYAPDCVFVFSCAVRRIFWGNDEVGKETEPYQMVAPTSGFYTAGEFLRTGDYVDLHNVTQVIAVMREGEAKSRHSSEDFQRAEENFAGKVSMINRMATFITVTTKELEEANRKLRDLAVTDMMTGVGNRTAYLEKIRALDEEIDQGIAAFTIFMFDLNGVKETNDKYGHECGDLMIADAADALKAVFGKETLYRIGGDEFVAIFEGIPQPDVQRHFRDLEEAITSKNKKERPYKSHLSVSKGAAVFGVGEDTTYQDVFRRADLAMYQEKNAYYMTHNRRKHK